MDDLTSKATAERRARILRQWGVNVERPLDFKVFADETIPWRAAAVIASWSAVAMAEANGDIREGEAIAVAKRLISDLTPADWYAFVDGLRLAGIRLSDAGAHKETA